jgi:uncharacterized protein
VGQAERAAVGRERLRWRQRWQTMSRKRAAVLGLLICAILAWALAPAARAVTLVANARSHDAPATVSIGIPVTDVRFRTADGVELVGWLARVSGAAPTMILVHGFKGARTDMLPWARFLYAAGYNVLLYDSRGCGASDGWDIGLGAREPEDVVAAVRYLDGRADLRSKRYGVLGVSLGAGIALLAAAREPRLVAVVADSAWTDERAQIARMGSLRVGPIGVPVLPYEPALVDNLIGGHLADARPLAAISQIAPRAVLLIHAADDQNTTTPLTGEAALFAAAGQPKEQWIAPSGGHIGALAAHPAEYQRHVLAFLAAHLGAPASF